MIVVKELRHKYSLRELLKLAEMPRSTFYYHLKRLNKVDKYKEIKDEILLNPLTRYKTKEKIGYNIVNELEELLENMCNLKSN